MLELSNIRKYQHKALTMRGAEGCVFVTAILISATVNYAQVTVGPVFKDTNVSSEAEVVLWETRTTPPSNNRDARKDPTSDHTCDRPKEISGQFTNCRAAVGGHFPASKAACECASCYLTLQLTCYKDGKWYPEVPNVCDPSTPGVLCGRCYSNDKPDNVRCDTRSKSGFFNEEWSCRCKNHCRETKLRCSSDGNWRHETAAQESICNQQSFHTVENGMNVTFSGGRFSVTCLTGVTLREGSATCQGGVLTMTNPECGEESGGTARTEKPRATNKSAPVIPTTKIRTPATEISPPTLKMNISAVSPNNEERTTNTPSSMEDSNDTMPTSLDTTDLVLIGVAIGLILLNVSLSGFIIHMHCSPSSFLNKRRGPLLSPERPGAQDNVAGNQNDVYMAQNDMYMPANVQ